MAYTRLSMAIQDEILRLKSLGHSQRKAAKLLGIDRGTVARYWQGPVEEFVHPPPVWASELDWDYIDKELARASRKIIYEELRENFNLPSYQAFCGYLSRRKDPSTPEITIKIPRNPGDSVEVDYSGDSVELLNPATSELYRVELFVGSLSYSGLFYVEFALSQKLEDFIGSHKNMFSYFGGVPSYIIPDNCKTAVIKADKLSPVINSTYQDMCRHYGVVVDPADKQSPRQKPNVENAVKYVQSDFMARVRNKTFTSLTQLNYELRSWLDQANRKVIQGRGKSRREFFEVEQQHLRALPSSPYELYYFKRAKVHPDCHIQHDKNYYSVPYRYVGRDVDIKFNSKSMHVYLNCERIASHPVMKGSFHYSTQVAHYPEEKVVEVNYHLGQIKSQARMMGENVELLIARLINESRYPLKILRKAQGIISLEKIYGSDILNYACGEALEFNRLNYDNVRRFAKHYQKRPKESCQAPKRQLELICLQGGFNERDSTIT